MDIGSTTAFSFNFLNHTINVTQSVVVQWGVMLVIIVLALIVTRKLKKVPDKKQSIVEMLVETVNGLVKANMGPKYKKYVPFIGTLLIYLSFLNLTGLIGVEMPTKDVNVTAAFALVTFFLIQYNSIKKIGPGGYLKGYVKPFWPMLPMNLIERFTVPISLCLRLFINMLVGSIVMALVYQAMGHFAFLVPIPLAFYFDIFDGLIQMFVFVMLTMVYVKMMAEE
jgi:F-type H+-transporting ATPase subunit a